MKVQKVQLVINGETTVELVPNGESKTYLKFKEPDVGEGQEKPLIASVYVQKGWKPE